MKKKLFLLLLFLFGFLAVQAGPYYSGLNHLYNLLQSIEEPILDNSDAPIATIPLVSNNDSSGSKAWEEIGGFTWSDRTVFYGNGTIYFGIVSIDWSDSKYSYTQKAGFDLNWTQPSQADIDEGPPSAVDSLELRLLKSLNFSGNQFRQIAINGNGLMPLQSVNFSNNPTLESLTISGCPQLTELIVDHATANVSVTDCRLPFSVLNGFSVASSNYTYAPQGTITKTFPVDAVDLSGEYSLGGNTTTFAWQEGVSPATSDNGAFTFNDDYIGRTVTCILTNAAFPQLTNGLEYQIKLKPSPSAVGEIADADDLNALRDGLYYQYVLTDDIDLAGWLETNSPTEGWTPINSFTGTLDGNGHVISGLWCDRGEDNVGLFGELGGDVEIKNLGVKIAENKSLKGKIGVGGIVGTVASGTVSIHDCFVTGTIECSDKDAGGIVGKVNAATLTIQNCYAGGELSATNDHAGGILGVVTSDLANVTVNNCYSTNRISSNGGAAGIVMARDGANTIYITNCAAINPSITGNGSYIARIIGYKQGDCTSVSNNAAFAGTLLNGSPATELTPDGNRNNGEDKSALELRTQDTYETGLSWDFTTSVWTMGNEDYPLPLLTAIPVEKQPAECPLHLADLLVIRTPERLLALHDYPALNCTLAEDIDLTDWLAENSPTEGWKPINNFSGNFDGNGHVISGLWINLPDADNVGLFAATDGNIEIKDLGIIIQPDKTIRGKNNVGGIIGNAKGNTSLRRCYVNGEIAGIANIGGIIGNNNGGISTTIEDCYATGFVRGTTVEENKGDRVGGIIGAAYVNTSIVRCYAANSVEDDAYGAGGIVGSKNGGTLNISNSAVISPAIKGNNSAHRIIGYGEADTYSDNIAFEGTLVNNQTVSGASDDENGLDKSALELRTQATYETGLGWDFTDTWSMNNADYRLPVLQAITAGSQPEECPPHLAVSTAWKADAASSSWTDADNWEDAQIPASCDLVIVNKNTETVKYYPEIPANTSLDSVFIAAGAEIQNQTNLIDTKIGVEYDLKAGRGNMLSVPLNTNARAFYFENEPQVELKTFTPTEDKAQWTDIANWDTTFVPGNGFAYRIEADNDKRFTVGGTELADGETEETLLFAGGTYFALAGNPFLTTIDFDKLQSDNPEAISASYLIWTEKHAFAGYNPAGVWGVTGIAMDNCIAPLQSFIVEKNESLNGNTASLTFDLSAVSVDASGKGILKSAENGASKLDIIAVNETASVLTFIANRENGNDSRKLKAALSGVPDIYTLKDGIALGANIINTDNILIPLGLATAYEGNMSLIFNGMNSYNARISLIDASVNDPIDLTGLSTYEYQFDYSPKTADGEIVPDEERFTIQISPEVGLDNHNASTQAISIAVKGHTVRITSLPSDRIKEILIYNTQGKLVYANKAVNASSHTINTPGNDGIHIVKVITENQVKIAKALIK
jgi:hypothetical protein